MAEYLIYNKDHYMESYTEDEVYDKELKDPKFKDNYDARLKFGDIIEVREDGYWTGPNGKGYNKNVFIVICHPGEPIDTKVIKPEFDIEALKLKKQRRFGVDLKKVNKLEVIDNKVSVTTKDCEKILVDKKIKEDKDK